MLDVTSELVVVVDTEGRIVDANDAAEEFTGATVSEAGGTSVFDFVHPEDVDAAVGAFTAGVQRIDGIFAVEIRVRNAAGDWHYVEAAVRQLDIGAGAEDRHVLVVRDITDRVLRRAAERASERRLLALVENIADVIVVLDAELSVTWTSPGIERFVDAPAYTNVGENAFNDMHPEDLEKVVATLGTVMEDPTRTEHVQFRLGHGRMGWRWVDATVVNRLDDPDVEGIVCALRDVTGNKEHDTELARLREQDNSEMARLRERDRFKDRFLATVSHELRTPLTAVIGFVAMLDRQSRDIDDETRRHVLDRIAANAQEMKELVERLLDVSRLQAGRVEVDCAEVDLGPAVSELIENLAPHLAQHVVDVEVEDGLVAWADRRAFDHVLRNLLTNAARYSAPGTAIDVRARYDDDRVVIDVTDRGIGIAPEDHGRVFQSFFQVNPGAPGQRGTGVGLNIARRYAQLQGGSLRLTSEPGIGSTFSFRLRATEPD